MSPRNNEEIMQHCEKTLPHQPTEGAALRIGFIGCGTIAAAVATGLARQSRIPIAQLAVSRRSRKKSTALQEQFPSLVTIQDDNQTIVDQSHIVFLCVLPDQANQAVRNLHFDELQTTLVSIVATANLPELAKHARLPLSNLAKMICTPSVADHEGACLLYPRQATGSILPVLLDSIGGCVQCDSNEQMTTLMSTTCVMGPVYGLLQTHVDWMVSRGIAHADASFLIAKQYQAIIKDLEKQCDNPKRLEQLIDEQTPGGINHQALENLDSLGAFRAYAQVMDAISNRISGKTDGSI